MSNYSTLKSSIWIYRSKNVTLSSFINYFSTLLKLELAILVFTLIKFSCMSKISSSQAQFFLDRRRNSEVCSISGFNFTLVSQYFFLALQNLYANSIVLTELLVNLMCLMAFNWFFLRLNTLETVRTIREIMNAPQSEMNITKTLPGIVNGAKSPQPTVVSVTITRYTASKYCFEDGSQWAVSLSYCMNLVSSKIRMT